MHITYETLTNGYEPIFLDAVSILSIISGIFVIITKNPVALRRRGETTKLLWGKLSNFGESLKFLISNYNRKIISGGIHVISQKMIEKEMGNHESKSVIGLENR